MSFSSTTETDSEPETSTADAVTTLTTFARLSAATRPCQGTVDWAVDTLATLDFRLVRQDTALHGLIQDCASTILVSFDNVLSPTETPLNFIPDVASILDPSFVDLLFQYRRLFRAIAARDFNSSCAPLAVICWVDLVLAKLGDVIAFVAAGFNSDHPDRSLPGSLKTQRDEDSLRAAIQLPDNWDMLPSMLLSERASVAAKRLSIRLMMGRYILSPVLAGQANNTSVTCEAQSKRCKIPFHNINVLLSSFAEFIRQSAARVDDLRSALGPGLHYILQQERLTSAMAISIFAAAEMARDSGNDPERTINFRPQTMAAAMQLLRFVTNRGECPTQINILSPLDHLDIPTSVIIQWGVVPRWTWSIWLECRGLQADTIVHLTTTYIRHQRASSGTLLGAPNFFPNDDRPSNQAAVISVMIDLVFRFISVLSTNGLPKRLSTSMMDVLHGACQLISHWIIQNSCGIQNSMECCKALIILFGYLSQNEQHIAVNDLVLECLACMGKPCIHDAWKAAVEDSTFCFLEALGQSFAQITATLSLLRDDLPRSSEVHSAQMMQFLVVMMFKGQPTNLDTATEFVKVVGEQVLDASQNDHRFLCEAFLTYLASAHASGVNLSLGKAVVTAKQEDVWRLAVSSGNVDLFLACKGARLEIELAIGLTSESSAAFSLCITSGLVKVEPLTYLEGLEHFLDVTLLICSRHFPREVEPLALLVLPMICDALACLLEHRDDTTGRQHLVARAMFLRLTGIYVSTNTRLSVLCNILRSLNSEENSAVDDRFRTVLTRRLSSATARRVLREMESEPDGETKREYELVFCRLDGLSHLLYVNV